MAPHGYTIRPATIEDLAHVLHHRRRMFEDMGYRDTDALDRMSTSSEVLLRAAIGDGSYRGWLVEAAGRVVAGGGVISLPFQGNPVVPEGRRSWIVNVYTEPEHRRQGLARWITETVVAWCRDAGLPIVFLHASDAGRPLYDSLGFTPTAEMMLRLR
jgi:GNAT superfamily N-acetyltransferase